MERKVIVVVDDTDAIRTLIAETLTEEGYSVLLAANGAEALAIVESTEPALILLDLNMPVLDGWGFAKTLAERALHFPIVILTAAGNAARHAKDLGAVGYIGKPFALEDLLTTVEQVFRADPTSA